MTLFGYLLQVATPDELSRRFPVQELAEYGVSTVLLFVAALVFCFAVMVAVLWLGWWMTHRSGDGSPYTGHPMVKGNELAFSAVGALQKFLDELADPDNPALDLERAAICRETGRVFPNALGLFGVIRVDWGFLERRYPGKWVSWGSLSEQKQEEMRQCHISLEGYQSEESCSAPEPKDIDLYHATLRPGPLYVDVSKCLLLGWKVVPGTGLEVLVLQRPYRKPPKEQEIQDHMLHYHD